MQRDGRLLKESAPRGCRGQRILPPFCHPGFLKAQPPLPPSPKSLLTAGGLGGGLGAGGLLGGGAPGELGGQWT